MKTLSALVLLALVLAGCATAALARAANATDRPAAAAAAATEQSGEELDDGDVDFPEEQGPEQSGAAPPPRRQSPPTPVSVYVFRLLEILTGAESFGKHTRFARQADGYPGAIDPPEAPRANTAASYSNYYDFLINEGSYKFWAVFQIGTAVLLTYSAFAALYYARYTYYTNVDYTDYDDYFFRRSGNSRSQRSAPYAGLSPTEYQRVMDAAAAGDKFKSPAKSHS